MTGHLATDTSKAPGEIAEGLQHDTVSLHLDPKVKSWSKSVLVALAERHSHRNDLVIRLKRAREVAESIETEARKAPAAPRALRYRLSPADREALVADYQRGAYSTDLTLRYGLSKGSVLAILHGSEGPVRRQAMTPEQIARATNLYGEGLSLAAVGTRLGLGASTVGRALRAAGVGLRPRGGSRGR